MLEKERAEYTFRPNLIKDRPSLASPNSMRSTKRATSKDTDKDDSYLNKYFSRGKTNNVTAGRKVEQDKENNNEENSQKEHGKDMGKEEKANGVLLYIDVALKGKQERITVREEDSADHLACEFADKHRINTRI